MTSSFTNKKKLQVLGMGALLLLIICYYFAIANTIDVYKSYRQEANMDKSINETVGSRGDLTNKEALVNSLFDNFVLDTLQTDKNLLAVASNYCKENGMLLKEYKPIGVSENGEIKVLTRAITVEAGYIKCLKLLYEMERRRKVGKIASVDFKSINNEQDKNIKLDCTIYVQNLIH